jgi:hypothetical protein
LAFFILIWAAIPPSVPAFFLCILLTPKAKKKELHSSRAAGAVTKIKYLSLLKNSVKKPNNSHFILHLYYFCTTNLILQSCQSKSKK